MVNWSTWRPAAVWMLKPADPSGFMATTAQRPGWMGTMSSCSPVPEEDAIQKLLLRGSVGWSAAGDGLQVDALAADVAHPVVGDAGQEVVEIALPGQADEHRTPSAVWIRNRAER